MTSTATVQPPAAVCPRTQEQILQRIADVTSDDPFGHQRQVLVPYLDFTHAKPWLGASVDAANWGEPVTDPIAEILEYLPFAWTKANDCRGLSAERTMRKMQAWLWLAGDDNVDWLDDYRYYGKAHLVAISERFGFDWRAHDDGHWRDAEDEIGISADEALGR